MSIEKNIFKELDCLSLTLLLTLNWDERLARRLLSQFGKRRTDSGDDGALTLYQFHRECHDADSAVPPALIRHFRQLYTREIGCLKAVPFEVADNRMLDVTTEGIGENPGAMFWAMALDERPQMQALLAYHAHRLLLFAFQGGSGSVFQEERIRTENKQLREQLRGLQNIVSELRMDRARLEAENAALKRRKEENTAMKRELRMLRYRLGHEQPDFHSPSPAVPPKEKMTVVETDPPDPVRRAECEERRIQGKCALENLKVALVGGISRLEDQYRSAFETLGAAKFYFHSGYCDGGGADRLRQTTRSADIVVFVTRVNSHNALDVVKGVCRKSGKAFLAVRETSPEMISRILLERLRTQKIAGMDERNSGEPKDCIFCPDSLCPAEGDRQ